MKREGDTATGEQSPAKVVDLTPVGRAFFAGFCGGVRRCLREAEAALFQAEVRVTKPSRALVQLRGLVQRLRDMARDDESALVQQLDDRLRRVRAALEDPAHWEARVATALLVLGEDRSG